MKPGPRDEGIALARQVPGPHSDGQVLADLLCFDLYSVSRAMTALYRPRLAPLGLTYPQFLILQVLGRRGPSTIGEIGSAARLDHGTLTPLLRRMADRDLVRLERSSHDARSVTVSLTDRGEGLRPALDDVHCQIRDAVGMAEADLGVLQDTLQELAQRLAERLAERLADPAG